MAKKFRFGVGRLDTFLLSVFYVISGGANAFILIVDSFRFMPAGVLAVLSFMVAYGLLKGRKWSVRLVVVMFFPVVTFASFTLYASVLWYTFYPSLEMLLFHFSLIMYIILSFISFVYVTAKRKSLQ